MLSPVSVGTYQAGLLDGGIIGVSLVQSDISLVQLVPCHPVATRLQATVSMYPCIHVSHI
jgi:hypothetical protein